MRYSHTLMAVLAVALVPSALAQTSRITVTGSVVSIVGMGDQGGIFPSAALGDPVTLLLTVSNNAVPNPSENFPGYEVRASRSSLSVGQESGVIAQTLDPLYATLSDNDSAYGDLLATHGQFEGSTSTNMQLVFIDAQNQQWSTDDLVSLAGLDFGPGTPDSYFQVYSLAGSVNFSIESIEFDGRVGTQFCGSPFNSTGARGEMAGYGSSLVARNDLTLTASSLPPGAPGFFLIGRTQGNPVQPGGSMGFLCLSGQIGRFVGPGQIGSASAAGTISLDVDLSMLPTPSGPVGALPGETWHVQLWHRDVVGGQLTSNLTRALAIVFE